MLHLPNIEIELRLGKQTQRGFDTDISNKTYEKLKNVLSSYNSWVKVLSTTEEDVFYNDVRCTNEKVSIIKKRLHVEDLNLSELDLRVVVNQEIPAQAKTKDITYKRMKYRTKYITRNWTIDLTKCISSTNTTYECELEFDTNYIRIHSLEFLKSEGIRQMKHLLTCANV